MKTKDMILRVISGGQTGADMGGLKAALSTGIATGGIAPKSYKNETGSDMSLKTLYGLRESDNDRYQDRTKRNIAMADLTLLFTDKASKGSDWTEKTCTILRKPFLKMTSEDIDMNAAAEMMKEAYDKKGRKIVLNIAGNRESKSPGIESRVEASLNELFDLFVC